jgi:pimeloyl-ACP methyl ester carboxylesterase
MPGRRTSVRIVGRPAAVRKSSARDWQDPAVLPPGFEDRRIDAGDVTIAAWVGGDGPPLLLLHGGAGDCRQFDLQRRAFAPRHRLVLPDSRAQGRTSDGSGPLTYHEMAEDVVALLDLLEIPRADVMGWSDGGNTGIDIAIHHPDRLAHLVTFGSNFDSKLAPLPGASTWGFTPRGSGMVLPRDRFCSSSARACQRRKTSGLPPASKNE